MNRSTYKTNPTKESHQMHMLSVETITPPDAAALLAMNVHNRHVRPIRVRKYAAEMATGRWLLTGEPIIINGTELVNGQHRLLACIEADTPFTTAVFRGAGSDVYAVVDSGLGRSPGDTLSHGGIKYANQTAAAARLVLGYRADALRDTSSLAVIATNQTIQDEVEGDPDRYERGCVLYQSARKAGFRSSALVAFHIILVETVGDVEALEWITGAIEGVGLQVGDPRIALRNWVINNRRVTAIVELSAWIRARNAHASRESRTVIKPWFTGTPFPRLVEETAKARGNSTAA